MLLYHSTNEPSHEKGDTNVVRFEILQTCMCRPHKRGLIYEPHHEKTCVGHMRTTKAQISLSIRTVWSAPLLLAAWIVYYHYLYITSTCYSWNFKKVASLISWAGPFESLTGRKPQRLVFSSPGSCGFLCEASSYSLFWANSDASGETANALLGLCCSPVWKYPSNMSWLKFYIVYHCYLLLFV